MKITQFGLCFSPNLGDGVIADCIAHGIRARRPDATVRHVDLSARQARGDIVVRNRALLLAILDRMPLTLRQRLAEWKLQRVVDAVAADWAKAARADLAIIGGGQIFADANLNFPVKIGRAAELIAQAGTPCAVYGVGVSHNWSLRGRALFAALQATDLRLVGVRDAGSQAAWETQLPGGPAPELTPDPGLLAAECYGPATDPRGIGICVTDFALLGHHASGAVAGAASDPLRFYAGIARAAHDAGQLVVLFCNGASEDSALLDRVARSAAIAPLIAGGHVLVPPAARTPAELAAIIAGCEAVIAHRLHACIVAYSYRRPIIGLGWDAKLEAFFETAGLSECFAGEPDAAGPALIRMAEDAMARGIDPDRHGALRAATWAGIDRLLACAGPGVTGPATG